MWCAVSVRRTHRRAGPDLRTNFNLKRVRIPSRSLNTHFAALLNLRPLYPINCGFTYRRQHGVCSMGSQDASDFRLGHLRTTRLPFHRSDAQGTPISNRSSRQSIRRNQVSRHRYSCDQAISLALGRLGQLCPISVTSSLTLPGILPLCTFGNSSLTNPPCFKRIYASTSFCTPQTCP